ncbi:hypothetical protein [Lapillicoccus jejuensis]|uniref:hypothetical protein n=1 Tax=Lapillicoccus jejuensis TaxID=402171 RepID=UPI001151A5BF|nr:hypothetical protein [Lapillicoccus jejuensis]
MSSVSEWFPSDGIVERLVGRLTEDTLPQVVVLPSERRDGIDLYSEADLGALKVCVKPDFTVDFLDGADDRRFLAEYSADVALAIAVGVASNISSAGLLGLANYVIERIRVARAGGTLADDAILEVRIAKIEKNDTDTRIEGVQINARAEEIAKILLETLGGVDKSRKLIREVDDI